MDSQPADKLERIHDLFEYDKSQVLGKSSASPAEVKKQLFALKIFEDFEFSMSQTELEYLSGEVEIQKSINHKHIVRLYSHHISDDTNDIILVLEYMPGGDLLSFIRKEGKLSERTALKFLRQILKGLKHLEEKKVVHRDLKSANILLSECSEDATVKLADFGVAKKVNRGELMASSVGTPLYMAPEILTNNVYDSKADIWSIGCILYEMLTGLQIYSDEGTKTGLIHHVLSEQLLKEIPSNLHPLMKVLLLGMLTVEPGMRMDLDQLLEHFRLNFDQFLQSQQAPKAPKPKKAFKRQRPKAARFEIDQIMAIQEAPEPVPGSKAPPKEAQPESGTAPEAIKEAQPQSVTTAAPDAIKEPGQTEPLPEIQQPKLRSKAVRPVLVTAAALQEALKGFPRRRLQRAHRVPRERVEPLRSLPEPVDVQSFRSLSSTLEALQPKEPIVESQQPPEEARIKSPAVEVPEPSAVSTLAQVVDVQERPRAASLKSVIEIHPPDQENEADPGASLPRVVVPSNLALPVVYYVPVPQHTGASLPRVVVPVHSTSRAKAVVLGETNTPSKAATPLPSQTLRTPVPARPTPTSPTVLRESGTISRETERKTFRYAELVKKPRELRPEALETYLSDDEFKKVFSMDRESFGKLKHWRQVQLKKNTNLF